jgi:hypothetical protein
MCAPLIIALILSDLTEGQIFSPLPHKALAFAVSLSRPTPPSCALEPRQPSHDPEPPPDEQPLKSSEAGTAHHLFHGHLVDDYLFLLPSGPALMSMSFPPSPCSSLNHKSAATTTR